MMTILVTGANGMLARDVKSTAPADAEMILTDVDELDITNASEVLSFCGGTGPDAILNCAAYTAVDAAETDAEAAYAVNESGPRNLAAAAAACGCPLVHVSTDFVFSGDGSHPLTEDDPCDPHGVYARSKRAGEAAIENSGADWLTVRTSWLYGVGGKSFPGTILDLARARDRLTVVDDQVGSPTYAVHLARALWKLLQLDARGYVHFCNTGSCSWHGFAVAAIEEARSAGLFPAGRQVDIVPVTSDEFPRPAPRPAYSVMDTGKYTYLAQSPPAPWREGVRDYMYDTINEQSRASSHDA